MLTILALSIQLADCCYLILLLALLCASASCSPLSLIFICTFVKLLGAQKAIV